jgi:hypothetical protein
MAKWRIKDIIQGFIPSLQRNFFGGLLSNSYQNKNNSVVTEPPI